MILVKGLICICFLVFISYRLGLVINHFTKKNNKVEIFLFGLLTFYAILQMILLPFVLLHTSFVIAYITTGIILVSLILLSFWMVKKEEEKEIWKNHKKENKTKQEKWKNRSITMIMVILILGQAMISTFLFRENADDSFYVSLATQSLNDEQLYWTDPSLGLEKEYSLLSSFEQITTYELGMAMIAKTFGIQPAILFHSILPLITIVFSYLAYYFLATKITDKKQAKLFLILLAILFLFTGFTSKFRTGCLLYKPWQGKAVFLNIGLTTLMGLLIKEKLQKQDVMMIAVTNIACVFLSSSAIFINSFAYIGYGVIQLWKRRGKEISKLIISFIPIIIYTILLWVLMKTSPLHTEIEFTEQNIKDLFLLFGSKAYLVLYGISVIIIALWGSKKAKKLLVGIPILNLLTIWNPLLINLIAKYLTSSVTFWRVIWLLPIEISICYSFVLLIQKAKDTTTKMGIFIVSILVIMVCGKFVYTKENGFHFPENAEKIPQEIVEQTDYILQHSDKDDTIMVLAPGEPLHSCTMRQLTDQIQLLYSRWMYFDDLISPEEIEERKSLFQIYTIGVPQYSTEQFNTKIEQFQIDWVIVPDTNQLLNEYLGNTILEKQINNKGYDLYHRRGKEK